MSFQLQTHKEVAQVTTYQDSSLGIMKWGYDNSYPQTLINLISQSANSYPAIQRTAQFYKGQGFEGDDTIVTSTGLTLGQVVNIMCDDYAYFKALALQTNYNLAGIVSSIFPMRLAVLRFNEFDELNYASKLGYHPNFGMNAIEKKLISNHPNGGNIKWFNRFNPNPEIITKQIETDAKGKIGDYNGQILYHSDSGHSSYPIAPLQPSINFVLSDIDNSILIRKESATGFSNTYLLKTSLSAEDETLARLEMEIAASQGARGSGRTITMSDLTPEEIKSTVLEEMGAGSAGKKSAIESAILTYELDQKVITGAYLIPPILAGISQSNGFTGVDLEDAYDVFNAITQPGRTTIEKQINRVLAKSKWADIGPIKIKPLTLKSSEQLIQEENENTADAINRNPLTGRQEQGLQRISRKYAKGQLSYDQAYDQLSADYGFEQERIEIWLPKNDEDDV
tara:strand:+ start:3146 stop:4504 length:1359 start_codon:yes stop_codon:yes gene_type:complete